MLKIDQLEISGFKTFVDPVSTRFSGGITAIVGPNGCGKSNLSDAITWVLGEQSAKSLRGGKMEDVIFSGSEKRRQLGMAEVSLSLETDGSYEQADDGRIKISRRIFRTGESQYRLNDKLVRLKDVKDLLMDTGLGIRAYSVIEQGRIGQILSSKPLDRRKLIEEAAGITRYKARKRIAELKLEDATANLLRLDDIVAEVERALRSLKRQANAARRFGEREKTYKDLLRTVLQGRWSQLSGTLSQLDGALEVLSEDDASLMAELTRSDANLVSGREALDELARRVAERHEAQARLAARIEGRQEQIKGAARTLQEIEQRLTNGREVAGQRRVEVDSHRSSLVTLREQHKDLLDERDEALAAVRQDELQLHEAQQGLSLAEKHQESVRSQMMASLGQTNTLQSRLHHEQIESEKASFRSEKLGQELATHRVQIEELESELAASAKRRSELSAQLEQQVSDRDATKSDLDATLAREATAAEGREQTRERLITARQQRKTLQQIEEAEQRRRDDIRESLAEFGIEDPRFLDEQMKVPHGWEDSLDLFLEGLCDAVLVPEDEDALSLARELGAGRAQVTLLRPHDEASEDGAVEDPAIVEKLGTAIGLDSGLAEALPPAYLVQTPDDAERLASLHRGVAFISRDRLWAQSGVLHLLGEKARPGSLSRQRELADLEVEIPQLEERRAELEAALEESVARRTQLATDLNRREEQIAATREEQAVAEARRQDVTGRHEAQLVVLEELEDEMGKLTSDLSQLDERRADLQQELQQARDRHAQLERRLEEAQQAVETAREAREALRTEGAGRRGRLDVLEERVAGHVSEAERIERQSVEVEGFISRWSEEEQELTGRIQKLTGQRDVAETELTEALESRTSAEDGLVEAQVELDARRDHVKLLDETVAELREGHDELRSNVEELRVQQAARQQEADHLHEAFRESFDAELPTNDEPPPNNLPELETEAQRLKELLDRMGPVNLLAAQEFDEQQERHAFLVEQRADVKASVESLRTTIREINKTSSERFLETFTIVNATFGETFKELFRGGEAQMRLLDEEDPLESGIEIVARPPGKRPQNIQLLSGGEKALAAIALLFALFKTKPSPFCILDEVDAPLDDANVLRFVEVLKRMAQDTQFLIVTHNKLTMECAETLYGVTMEERGVSKLVGVEVAEMHPETQLVSA